ncbi:MAG: hypothetical protein EON86_16435 [Brevundimonas sp.]|nr:MAG: hypothetical protein EON86_16435 [Brevundimonas sp.]
MIHDPTAIDAGSAAVAIAIFLAGANHGLPNNISSSRLCQALTLTAAIVAAGPSGIGIRDHAAEHLQEADAAHFAAALIARNPV